VRKRIELPAAIATLVGLTMAFVSIPGVASAGQSTLNVGPGREFVTIQSAVDAAHNGDLILVDHGVYRERVLIHEKYVTLTARARGAVTLQPPTDRFGLSPLTISNQPKRVDAVTTVSKLRITGGRSRAGGGGAVSIFSASPRISANIIEGNYSEGYGGGIAVMNNGEPLIYDNLIRGNFAERGGGGIFGVRKSSPRIVDNVITENRTAGWMTDDGMGGSSGGGIYLENVPGSPDKRAPATILGNTIARNSASFAGGGIMLRTGIEATIVDNEIVDNTAIYGGGIHVETAGSTTVIDSNRVRSNSVAYDATFPGSGYGGGIALYDHSQVTVTANEISSNTATNGGAGISSAEGAVSTVSRNWISENLAGIGSGAALADGGGLYVAHSHMVAGNNVIVGNTSDIGGGIGLSDGANVSIENNTIVGNEQLTAGGGAIFVQRTVAGASVVNNILVDNRGFQIFEEVPRARIVNNLINFDANFGADRGSGIYLNYSDGALESAVQLNSLATETGGNIGGDPMFAAPSESDYSLLSSSPAIGVGTSSLTGEDLRDYNNVRRVGTNPDLGALATPGGVSMSSPSVSGDPQVGSKLLVEPPVETVLGADSVRYSWQVNGKAVVGADGDSYTVRAQDVGKRITVRVSSTYFGVYTRAEVTAPTVLVRRS
jgi:hypothetical protein